MVPMQMSDTDEIVHNESCPVNPRKQRHNTLLEFLGLNE